MTETIGRLQLPDEYRAEREQIFPSREAFDWFLRNHRDELVKLGALIKPTGRWLVRAEAFDAAILAIGARRALKSNAS